MEYVDLYTFLSLPIMIVWREKTPLRKKLMLMTSLTVVVITVSIIRVALTYTPSRDPSVSWLYLWSSVKMMICMF